MFWRKLQNKEIVISKPHIGRKPFVLFLIVLLVGILMIDQGLKKPGVASPILRIDPFTTIWDGRVNGASSPLASYDPSPPSNTLTGMTQVSDYTGECYSGSLITSGTLLAIKLYLSKTGTPSQTFNGQIWSTTGIPGTSGGGRCVRSVNLATSSNTIDSSTITVPKLCFSSILPELARLSFQVEQTILSKFKLQQQHQPIP